MEVKCKPEVWTTSFTTKSKSAVAYLGNTRVGWIGPSDKLHQRFNKILLDGITNIGIAENLSKIGKEYYNKYLATTHNILGCPEIPIWTVIPQKITDVSSNDMVYVTPLFNNNSPQYITLEEAQTNPLYKYNYGIAKIKQNFYPFFFPIYLENISLHSEHNVFGGDIEMGRSSNVNATQGNFVIGQNGELNIEATGTVTIKQGTVIKNGGKLCIKHIKQ